MTISIFPISQKPVLSVAKSNDLKPDLLITDVSNNNIRFSTLLPVPEKKNQLYLVIFYHTANETSPTKNEPLVVVLNTEQITKQLVGDDKIMKPQDDLRVFLQRQFQISGFKLADPFSTTTSSPKAPSFVTAHRGTKEGLLYFLPQHILFGFKKPILLFLVHEIAGITYTSITRITFSVTLKLKNGEKIEFSMIDQQDFPEIDEYVKNMRVEDMSMSDELKAKSSKNTDQQNMGALAEAEAEAESNIREGDEQLDQLQGGGDEADSDDEEEDSDFEVESEVDDTSDISSDEENSDAEQAEEAEEEDEEDEDNAIELNSDDE